MSLGLGRLNLYMATLWDVEFFSFSVNSWKTSGLRIGRGSGDRGQLPGVGAVRRSLLTATTNECVCDYSADDRDENSQTWQQ